MWSSDSNPSLFLKIISALSFEDKWQDRKFTKIGKRIFTSFDNQQIQVEYMKNTVNVVIKFDPVSNWQAVRIFYYNNYALDIIIPEANLIYSEEDKTKIMTDLIVDSNKSGVKYDTNLPIK